MQIKNGLVNGVLRVLGTLYSNKLKTNTFETTSLVTDSIDSKTGHFSNTLTVQTSGDNYNQGIRINSTLSSGYGSWVTIAIGGIKDSTSGKMDGQWGILRNSNGNLLICNNSSEESSGLTLYRDNSTPTWRGTRLSLEGHTHSYAGSASVGGTAYKAEQDASGQKITSTYIKGLSVSGRTITYTRGDGSTGTITTQDTNTDTDTLMTQTATSTNANYPILLSSSTATGTRTGLFASGITINPSTNTITATTFAGNANSANKLKTARTISLSGSVSGSASFDGSGNITISTTLASLSNIYLPLTGGTLTGMLTAGKGISIPTVGGAWTTGMAQTQSITFTGTSTNLYHPLIRYIQYSGNVANLGAIDTRFGFFTYKSGRTDNMYDYAAYLSSDTGVFYSSGGFSGELTGNASSATKLKIAKTINGVAFDGTSNITVYDSTKLPTGGTAFKAISLDTYTSTVDASRGGLFMFQKSGDSDMMPDTGWWSLIRTQHPGYASGYWQDLALNFDGTAIKFRARKSTSVGGWKTVAFTDSSITGNAATASKLNASGNESIIANGYSDTAGLLYINYRGATNAITQYIMCNGLANDVLADVKANSFIGTLTGNAATASNLSGVNTTLSTGAESSAIKITTGTQGDLNYSDFSKTLDSSAIIKNAINFNWYDTVWKIGNIRGGSTNSLGFGMSFGNNLKFMLDISGNIYLPTGTTVYANLSGNATSATSATKATQDSAGQQINSTYIKSLSVSGKTITYTKGNGTTGTITTQDTNTDTLMTQTLSTALTSYPVLLSSLATTGTRTGLIATGVVVNPGKSSITANVFNGYLDGTALSAEYTNYLNIMHSNEIRFANYTSNIDDLWFGFAKPDGSTTYRINRYVLGNGQHGRANLSTNAIETDRITIPTAGHMWLEGANATDNIISLTNPSSDGYNPFMNFTTYYGNRFSFGGFRDSVGFFGYKSDRTENGFDCAAFLQVGSTGAGKPGFNIQNWGLTANTIATTYFTLGDNYSSMLQIYQDGSETINFEGDGTPRYFVFNPKKQFQGIVIDSYEGYLRPQGNGNYSLGNSVYRFYQLNATHATNVSSLYEMKERISVIDYSVRDDIMDTEVCEYYMKAEHNRGEIDNSTKYGFVIGGGYKMSDKFLHETGGGINEYNCIGVLTKASQELYSETDALKEEITELKERIRQLENAADIV